MIIHFLLKLKKLNNLINKDMIFEILMMRFDILQQNRKAINSIFNYLKKPQEFIIFIA